MSDALPSGGRDSQSAFKRHLRDFGIGLFATLLGIVLGFLLGPSRVPETGLQDRQQEYRREFHTYLWGYVLALLLTLVPFGLVYWRAMMPSALYLAIGAFAIVQAVVHFRCFLHIDPPRQNTDDLYLILFSTLLLLFMTGGTIWILANLAGRMH